jgi:hypothetical protein
MAPRKPAPAEEPTPAEIPAPEGEQPPADGVPVFAPAEEPTPAAAPFITSLPDWLQDNYRELVADENRGDSFTALADRSTGSLAAWARHEAALHGEDITPTDATPTEGTATRGAEDQ